MKHPNAEEWIAFLYGEVNSSQKAGLTAHLRSCDQCSAAVRAWRGSMNALDQWAVPDVRHTAPNRSVVRWAAAAAIVLFLGFGLGRFASPSAAEMRSWRSSLEHDFDRKLDAARSGLAEQMNAQHLVLQDKIIAAAAESAATETRQLLTDFVKSSAEKSDADRETIASALKQLDARWISYHDALRKELETVAVLTEDGLADTQQQLVQLAGITQPQ
jgi:hypothetical protein